jgi:hypothetical protein
MSRRNRAKGGHFIANQRGAFLEPDPLDVARRALGLDTASTSPAPSAGASAVSPSADNKRGPQPPSLPAPARISNE